MKFLFAFFVLFFSSLVPHPSSFVYAAAPTIGTLTPSSGTTTPDTVRTFTAAYSDADGWANLKEAYFLVSASTTALANSAYLYYDQNVNLLYVRNDANTAWLGGFAPGTSNSIENAQVKLNCASTTVVGSGTTLTVTWNITFKPAYSGTYFYMYLYVKDDTGGAAGWTLKGSYTVNRIPQSGIITPASGTGQVNTAQTFAAAYSDPDGWQNLQFLYFVINTSASAANCFYAYYNQNTNKLYMLNDAGGTWLGGYAPGSGNVIENSYAKLNCATTTVSGSDTMLTVNWSVTLKPPFTGTRNTYLTALDDRNYGSGWKTAGTWTIPNSAPQAGTVSPSFGASIPDTTFHLTTGFSDGDTWLNIQYAYFLISASSAAKTNAVYGYYDQNTYRLYLRNDDDTAWLGGYAPGASNVIENSQVKVYCASTTAAGSGNALTVKWALSFKSAFLGTKNVYLSVQDDAGSAQGLSSKGTWTAMSSGVVVDQNGGEAASSDARVRLVIPQGALEAPTAIHIASVTGETLEGAVPSGSSLLSAVECKPYGLTFGVPASLTYMLAQAEVPGTPVELGLYDSAQAKIVSTGQTAVIGADGYTAAFSVTHFSMYAALKNMVPQAAPIGAGVKIPLPDMFTGAFSHAIPLAAAPGRRGMQPALAISCRSGNPNSWVGLGASLNPGHIVRSTRLGPPSYNDTQDTFYFTTDAGATELVWLIDNLYQAKIESSFTKFYKEADDSWRVVAKDGSVLRLGAAPDAKETAAAGTFSWYLTRATDTNGNYIDYAYTKDGGKVYLSRIDYTGHESGVAPTNTVEFTLEPREDVFSSYMSTAKITTALRLKEVVSRVNGELVWRHALEYAYSLDTHRSLLVGVTTYAADGKALPAQRMMYQESK